MIIDDTEDLLKSLTFAFRMEDYNVLPFRNASEAIRELDNQVPDLIITDLSMPGIDGFDFIRILKRLDKAAHVPIAIFSARPLSENLSEAMSLDVSKYISKPCTIENLLTEINEILETKNG